MGALVLKRMFVLAAVFILTLATARGGDDNGVEARRKQLNALLGEEWEYELRESPEFATIVGDYRYNDRWSDPSPVAHGPAERGFAEMANAV
jgi:hypothetical protein